MSEIVVVGGLGLGIAYPSEDAFLVLLKLKPSKHAKAAFMWLRFLEYTPALLLDPKRAVGEYLDRRR